MSKLAHFSASINGCDMAGMTAERKSKGNTLYEKPPSLCRDCSHYSSDLNLCASTKEGLSARTIASVFSYSKALAAWRGKDIVSEEELKSVADPRVAEGVKRVRSGQVKIHPGYDGEYGKISIFNEEEREELEAQKASF